MHKFLIMAFKKRIPSCHICVLQWLTFLNDDFMCNYLVKSFEGIFWLSLQTNPVTRTLFFSHLQMTRLRFINSPRCRVKIQGLMRMCAFNSMPFWSQCTHETQVKSMKTKLEHSKCGWSLRWWSLIMKALKILRFLDGQTSHSSGNKNKGKKLTITKMQCGTTKETQMCLRMKITWL